MAEEFLADWQQKLQQMHAKEVASGQPLVPLMPQGEDDYIGYSMNEALPSRERIQNATESVTATMEQWDPAGEFGPNGEKLPPDAVGWDQAGIPYYGPGFEGWYKRFKYRVGGPPEVVAERNKDPEERKTALERSQDWAAQQLTDLGMVKKKSEGEGYEPISVKNVAGKMIKGVWVGATDALQTLDDTAERAVGANIETLTDVAKQSNLPELDIPMPEVQVTEPKGYWAENVGGMIDTEKLREQLYRISPVHLGYNLVRAFEARISGEVTREEFQEIKRDNWQAARIQYTYVFDPMVKEEFLRRYKDGEDPNYLAMQLENPVAEMVGEFIVDGSIALDLGAKMLGITDAARLAKASDIYGMAPQVRKAIEEAGDTAEGFESVVRTVQKTSSEIATGVYQHANKTGLQELLADAKKALYTERVGQAMRNIASTFKGNPDDVGDIMDALVKVHSGNLDEVRDAVVTLQHFGSETLFSQASMELGYFLRKGLLNADGVVDAKRFIETLGDLQQTAVKTGNMDDLINFADSKIKQATAGTFKTVLERAEAGEKINSMTLNLAKADVMASVPVNLVNQFLASIYMGISPAYAMRNLMQNTIQIVIDKGWGTGLQAAGASLAEIPAWIARKEHGAITYNALEDIKRMGGAENLASLRGIGSGASMKGVEEIKGTWKKIFSPFLELGGRFEQAASAIVVRNRMYDDMTKMLMEGRAIPETAELIAKGVPEDTAKGLVNLMRNNWGDVDTVMDIYKDGMKKGYVTLFESGEWLDKVDKKLLAKNGWLEKIKDAGLAAKTKDELIEEISNIKKSVMDEAVEALKKQEPGINPEDPTVLGFQDALFIGEEPNFTGKQSVHGPIFNARMYWNRRVSALYDQFITSITPKVGDQNKELANLIANMTANDIPMKNAMTSAAVEARRTAAYTIRDKVYNLPQDVGTETLAKYWDDLGLPSPAPADLDKHTLFKNLWENFFDTATTTYAKSRDELVDGYYEKIIDVARKSGIDVDNMPQYQRIRESLETARKFDNAVMWAGGEFLNLDESAKKTFDAIAKLANEYGIPTLTDTGKYNNKHIYNILKKYGDAKHDTVFEYSFDEAKKALDNYADAKGIKKVEIVTDEGLRIGKAEQVLPTYNGSVAEATAHNLNQQMPKIESEFDKIIKSIEDNWGKVKEVPDNPDQFKAVESWLETARGRVADARAAANATAAAERDFILHDYTQKRGFDRALGYVMPFEFWYSRTYSKWIQRAFENPGVIAAYARYRRTLEKVHAGMPEWWRYQINTNELLGLDMENPLYFNLEATLNPLNGLTGVDFNDPGRRPAGKIEWLTTTLDEISKFGPSTWTPLSWMTALALYKMGESEAAMKWAGRMVPGTAGVKAATHLMGIGPAGGLEIDPFVNLLYKGTDAYERRRVGRALATMVADGQIDEASGYDSAFYQDDENWEIAKRNAAQARAWGQVSSFFLGVGFKGRTESDMEIDKFYTDYYATMGMRADLTSQEFRERLDALRSKYPFMDTVLLSRKGGYERDTAYAYGVLGRVPPGQSDQLAEWAGIDYQYFNKFYEDKGKIENWDKADRDTFMAAMMNIGTILDIPDEATTAEWTQARNAYTTMNQEMQRIFGDNILEKVDEMYQAEDMDGYIAEHPEVEKALDWKNIYMMENQTLMTYYKGIDGINKFYKSFANDQIREELGKGIYDLSAQYKWLKDNGGDHKGFLQEHPELKRYWEIWDEWDETIATETLKFGTRLPEMKPATIRPGVEPKTIGEKQLFEEMQRTEPLIPWEQWQDLLPATEVRNFMSGIEPDRNSLQLYADVLGLDLDVMIDMVRESLPSR